MKGKPQTIVGFHADKEAQMLVSTWTLRCRVVQYRLEDGPWRVEITGFSVISDEQLENLIERCMSD